MNLHEEIKMQIAQLNMWTKAYDEGHPIVDDKTWDEAFFRLQDLENKSGIFYDNSPTQKVVYEVQSELKKIEHNHPMLSADKTKDWNEFVSYFGSKDVVGMLKLDGLTLSLRYMNGHLVSAETRGDGMIGEDVTMNAMTIRSIPKYIGYPDELVVDGEIICRYQDFEEFSEDYANPRNFASGSIRLLDPNECKKRKLTFVAWNVVKGMSDNLIDNFNDLQELGFIVAPWTSSFDWDAKDFLIDCAKDLGYPIDGLIGRFTSREYGESLGATGHHSRAIYAFKFYDESAEARLRLITWQVGRSGVLTPVANFDPIELEGTTVERASLHNYSVMRELLGDCAYIGMPIKIYKANQIIPQVLPVDEEFRYNYGDVVSRGGCPANDEPEYCPCCGHSIDRVKSDSGVINLYCENLQCGGRLAERIEHWCSKKGLDIKGISEATISLLINEDWLTSIQDLYRLRDRRSEWMQFDGWGEKSVDKILDAIDASKKCKLIDFIGALGIPLIGKTVAKDIVSHFSTYAEMRAAIDDHYNFAGWGNWGDAKEQAMYDFDWEEADELAEILDMTSDVAPASADTLSGKTFVITGKLSRKRDLIVADVESAGGKVQSSVSSKTQYLVCNQPEATAKYKKAQELNIPIITEEELMEIIK